MGEPDKAPIQRPRLGRGLSSLISSLTGQSADGPQYSPEPATPEGGKAAIPVGMDATAHAAMDVPLDLISPNPFQPRRDFPSQELADLAASIAKHGVLQPIRLTRSSDPSAVEGYTLIAGERRLRAAKAAGLKAIPAVVSEATQEQMLQWAVIENVQRADLNPIDRGEAYSQFLNRFGVTQADLAQSLGEPRTTIANYLRILDLHPDVRAMISAGTISFGHAKVLASLVGREAVQLELAKRVQAESISVRELESLVAKAGEGAACGEAERRPVPAKAAYIRDLEERLSSSVGTRVWVRPGRAKNTGKVVIEYYGLDDFDRIAERLGVKPEE